MVHRLGFPEIFSGTGAYGRQKFGTLDKLVVVRTTRLYFSMRHLKCYIEIWAWDNSAPKSSLWSRELCTPCRSDTSLQHDTLANKYHLPWLGKIWSCFSSLSLQETNECISIFRKNRCDSKSNVVPRFHTLRSNGRNPQALLAPGLIAERRNSFNERDRGMCLCKVYVMAKPRFLIWSWTFFEV